MRIIGPGLGARTEYERILRSLPEWFGIEAALRQYVEDCAHWPTFAIVPAEQIEGFITLRRHFAPSWEVHCLAVQRDQRGQGLGQALLAHALRWVAQQGATVLQVKTLAAAHPSPAYAQTRTFYLRMGFVPVEVFPTLWSSANPCLQMIKIIAR